MTTNVPTTYTRIVVPEAGDASVLKLETNASMSETLSLTGNDLLVKVSFAGINFIDTYFRSGLYKRPFPYSPGTEGSGVVVAVGPDVSADDAATFIGKKVAFYGAEMGTYSQYCRVQATNAFIVPEGVDMKDAAALLLQGCTAHYLTHDTYATKPGDIVLVHAAAGGTGLLITQMAKHRGATVIGICGGEAKAALAKSSGKCDFVIDYKATPDWEKEVLTLTKGQKCNVVYDGVGKSTFAGSLASLRPRGMMVSFGNASGAVDPISPLVLSTHGSLFLTRPKLNDYMRSRKEAEARVAAVFGMVREKSLQVTVHSIPFKLDKSAQAHEALESRKTTGKLLINCQE